VQEVEIEIEIEIGIGMIVYTNIAYHSIAIRLECAKWIGSTLFQSDSEAKPKPTSQEGNQK
jgi:hypothetical protein